MKTIHLFADAHPQGGLGHLRRMQKLKALLKPLAQVRLFAPHPLADEPLEWLNAKILGGHLCVVDSYLARPDFFTKIQTPLILFEDFFQKREGFSQSAAFFFNPAHNAHTHYPKDLQTNPHYFLGSAYLPIDPTFCCARFNTAKSLKPAPQEILLCLGGSDLVLTPLKRTLGLLKNTPLNIHTIAPKSILPQLPKAANFSFEPLLSPQELAQRLFASDIALFGGGQMLYEAILSQTPLMSLPIASNQLCQVQALTQAGALLPARLDNLLSTLQALLDLKTRTHMQEAQKNLKLGDQLLPALQKILDHA
ncbi:hypothetical protein [Helicobacter ailurogastricus]|uniref:hypothetical protein n=1 Tax=Helicobacter ailurogastricus TaxID=1578720 RepID=UPI0024912725|nr:hypothetical protein [Helicobacter ailurogastricus]